MTEQRRGDAKQHTPASLADVLERNYFPMPDGAKLYLAEREWRMVVNALRSASAAPSCSESNSEQRGAGESERPCTCHPCDRPTPCQHKYALMQCLVAAAAPSSPGDKNERTELIRFWRTFPAHSNEVAAADIIEQLERELADMTAKYAVLLHRLAPDVEYVEGMPVGYGEDEIDRLHRQLYLAQSASGAIDLLRQAREYVQAHHIHNVAIVDGKMIPEPCARCELLKAIDATADRTSERKGK